MITNIDNIITTTVINNTYQCINPTLVGGRVVLMGGNALISLLPLLPLLTLIILLLLLLLLMILTSALAPTLVGGRVVLRGRVKVL